MFRVVLIAILTFISIRQLLTVDQVIQKMALALFKPNCALGMYNAPLFLHTDNVIFHETQLSSTSSSGTGILHLTSSLITWKLSRGSTEDLIMKSGDLLYMYTTAVG